MVRLLGISVGYNLTSRLLQGVIWSGTRAIEGAKEFYSLLKSKVYTKSSNLNYKVIVISDFST